MVRVFDFEQDGVKVKLAAMSWTLAEKHVAEGQELLARGDVTPNEWFQRIVKAVETSMERADAGAENTLQGLKDAYDVPTLKDVIPAMYERLMVVSGLRNPEGEEKAAPISANSAAA